MNLIHSVITQIRYSTAMAPDNDEYIAAEYQIREALTAQVNNSPLEFDCDEFTFILKMCMDMFISGHLISQKLYEFQEENQ